MSSNLLEMFLKLAEVIIEVVKKCIFFNLCILSNISFYLCFIMFHVNFYFYLCFIRYGEKVTEIIQA